MTITFEEVEVPARGVGGTSTTSSSLILDRLVEVTGFEPATSTMRTGFEGDSGETDDRPMSEEAQVEGQISLFGR